MAPALGGKLRERRLGCALYGDSTRGRVKQPVRRNKFHSHHSHVSAANLCSKFSKSLRRAINLSVSQMAIVAHGRGLHARESSFENEGPACWHHHGLNF